MSTSLRRRAPCQTCGVMCQVEPLEVMLRGGKGWRGHWMWSTLRACPPCQSAALDALELHMLEEPED